MPMRKKLCLFPLLALTICLPALLGWVGGQPARPACVLERKTGNLVVASINLAKVTDTALILEQLAADPALSAADVILFQEVVRPDNSTSSVAEVLAQEMGWHSAFASPQAGRTESGLGIISRFPLGETKILRLKDCNLVFRSRKRIALAVTLNTASGPVRLINTHLDTRINPTERIAQLMPAIQEANGFPGAALIGGDFNTNDMQWVSHIVPVPFPGWQGEAVRRLMLGKGFSTPFIERRAPFDHLGMQLDWIFALRAAAARSGIQPLDFSDHHAVWAEIRL
jgi:endonuclease/exonuclease/phosphatase family metal-dependent hydrolase